jgi:hypothetical protein
MFEIALARIDQRPFEVFEALLIDTLMECDRRRMNTKQKRFQGSLQGNF